MKRAFVLGGGVAGIAAALHLLESGHRVELLEAHGWLGGRAFSFHDRRLDAWLDNGPHVVMGCYDHMRRLLRRLGTEGEFEQARTLRMCYVEEGGRTSRLVLGSLPTPLAMPAAWLGLRALDAGARLRGLRGFAALARRAPAGWSLEDWIIARRQHGAPRRFLWDPLCHAIMNAPAARVAADVFVRTLRRAFGGSAARSAIWLPRRPWSMVLGEPAVARIRAAGGLVGFGCRVARLELRASRVAAIELHDGAGRSIDDDDLVVSALPWHALARVLEGAAPFAALASSPLVTAHFELARGNHLPMDDPLVALVGGQPFHFLAQRPTDRDRFAVFAGGSLELDGLTVAEIEQRARAQLRVFLPGVPAIELARTRVTKEARATFLAAPRSASLRPDPGCWPTARNLRVCGDWTHPSLPATLEGAAESAAIALADVCRSG